MPTVNMDHKEAMNVAQYNAFFTMYVFAEAMNVAQQVLALDTRYNACRTLPRQNHMLYLRRRNQLLQENATRRCGDSSIRRSYLHLRAQVLTAKYGHLVNSGSRSTGSMRGSGRHSLRQSMESLPVLREGHRSPSQRDRRRESLLGGLVPTHSAEASRAMAGDTSLAEHYAFCGMHHIFDRHKDAVTSIRFANDSKSLLACGSRDGSLSVFNLTSEPPSLVATLRGHQRPVNDFDWSVANELLVSVSSDGTARLWDPTSGVCVREISESGGGRCLCCRFHPNNNNLVAIGNSKSQVKVFNISTGKAVKGGASKLASSALCMAFDSTHSQLWVGDSKGSVYNFSLDSVSGKLHRLKRLVVSPGHMVTCISYRTWVNREARDPSLLISSTDDTLRLFRLLPDSSVYMKRRFGVPHHSLPVLSAFCPLMSFLQGACVVSGSEDCSVYFFDVETGAVVNRLQGHSAPVLAVTWTYDESLLASADTDGTVIVWKREQKLHPQPLSLSS